MRSPSPRPSIAAAISSSAAPSAQVQAAAEPPPGAGVAAPISSTREANGSAPSGFIERDAIPVASLNEFVHSGGAMSTAATALAE